MAFNIVMSDQIAVSTGVKILIYSEAGIGKTSLVATLPRPILISAESGLLSLQPANLDRMWGASGMPYSTQIPTIQIDTLQDLEDAYNWIVHQDNDKYFDSVAIDSITEIAEKCLAHFKPLNKDPRKAYGEMQEHMIDIVKKFRDLSNKHVYISAKLGKDKDEVSGMTLYGPSMPGKQVGPALPYLFDEVFRYLVLQQTDGSLHRVLQTKRDISSDAKDRSGTLEQYEFPHLGYIINKIKGTK